VPCKSATRPLMLLCLAGALLAIATLSSCATGILAEEKPLEFDATVRMSGGLVAVGMGYGWGHGTLSYQGTDYPFCVRGPSFGDVAAASLQAEGLVFNLHSLEDFPGRYLTFSTGAALVRGESAATLKNEHGVTMQLETKVRGLRLNIAASHSTIVLAGQHGCSAPSTSKR
jgi:hypothetical protein